MRKSNEKDRNMLDARVLKAITKGWTTAGSILASVKVPASMLSTPHPLGTRIQDQEMRAVDRSLQRLRKAGVIEFKKGHWHLKNGFMLSWH